MARPSARGLERDLRDPAHVDADRRQDQARSKPVDQPFLACHAVRHRQRAHDFAHPYGSSTFEIDFDFIDHQLIVQVSDGRVARVALEPQTTATFYGRLMDEMRKLGLHVDIHRQTERSSRPDPFRPGPGSLLVRRGLRQPVLANPRAGGPGLQGVPQPLHRQVQSGAFFLGRARPGGHAVFRTAGAGTSGRDPQPPGLDHPRGLFTRSQQLRLLARWGRCSLRRVLLLRLSATGRIRASGRPARCGVLQQRAWGVHPSLRCRPAGGLARSRAARVPANHL